MKTFLSQIAERLCYETPGDAGGAGSGAGGGAGQGFSGGGSGQGPGGSAGGGAPQFTKIDPNAHYDFGDGKPTKYADYMSRHMPRESFDKGREYLLSEAAKLERLYGQFLKPGQQQRQQPQQQVQPQPRVNPMAKFADAPVVDGRMLGDAYQAMADGDIKPMRDALTKIAQVVQQQNQTIQQLRQGYGSITEQGATQDYRKRLDSGLESLGVDAATMKAHPILRDLAEDVYLSHDPKDPNLNKEFPTMLKNRVEAMTKFVHALDQAKVAEAKNQRRTFVRPGGNAQPGQAPRYQHETGATLARRLFA